VTAIDVDGVTKQFGGVTALRDLHLTVERGEVFGFLGPNGAGKSTTIDVLLDYVRPTNGRATVLGLDAQADTVEVRRRTGVLPDGFGVLGRMTGREHVEFAIESKDGDEDPDVLMERTGIDHAADRPAERYSKGMAQRLMLSMALAGEPDLLILDEPTTGLDPTGAREMRQIVTEEAERGATVFFSSHILEQVEAVCDRVGILNQGSLVTVDTIDGLREAAGTTGRIDLSLDALPGGLPDTVRAIEGVSEVEPTDDGLSVTCAAPAKGEAVRACYDAGAPVRDIETSKSSLEDIFVTYTGGNP
jgi:ABC-2 type transport system ATP-binding protein